VIARWVPRCGGVASRGYVTKAGRTRLCAYPCFGTEALGPGPVDGACDFLVNGIPAQAYCATRDVSGPQGFLLPRPMMRRPRGAGKCERSDSCVIHGRLHPDRRAQRIS